MNYQFSAIKALPFSNWKKQEADLLRSMENLCRLHKLAIPDLKGLVFPENIIKAREQLCTQLNKKGLDCLILEQKGHATSFVTVATFSTGHHLYYIPLRPVWELSQSAKEQGLLALLLSMCRYFYQVINVSFYGEEGFLQGEYAYLRDCADQYEPEDKEGEQWREEQHTDLESLEYAGKWLLIALKKNFTPFALKEDLEAYRKEAQSNSECCKLAEDLLKLIADHPHKSLRQSIPFPLEDEIEERIEPEQYLSFFWSAFDSLNVQLIESINCTLQEAGYQDEPFAVQWFDTPQQSVVHDLDFEQRLFDLIIRLINLLESYDHEQPHQPTR